MISFIKKKILLLTTIVMVSACSFQAQSQVDSLYDVLNSTKSDSIRAQCYLALSGYYLNHKMPDSSILYADKGLELANTLKMKPDWRLYQMLIKANDASYQYKKALEYYKPLLINLKESKNPEEQAW